MAKKKTARTPLEERLPAVLQNRTVALVLALLMGLVGVLGLGAVRLRADYAKTACIFTQGTAGDGYSIAYDLSYRQQIAQSLLAEGSNRRGDSDPYVVQVRSALNLLPQQVDLAVDSPSGLYRLDRELGSAVEALVRAMGYKNDPVLAPLWAEFTAREQIMDGDGYNDAAQKFNRRLGQFPANIIGALWGVPELERFA